MNNKTHDLLIVGAGFFGAVCAHELRQKGLRCLVVDQRPHIGGNCHTEERDGIQIHKYGAHIFHTADRRVWDWINQFARFNDYRHRLQVSHCGRRYSFPPNLATFRQLWNVQTAEEALAHLARVRQPDGDAATVEGWALAELGPELYETFIRGYTQKQWGRPPSELPASIIRRLPIRLTEDDHYFDDPYQGIPVGGYTPIFEKLLSGTEVLLNTDYFAHRRELDSRACRVLYTGPIDRFFDHRFGRLEYRSLRFETELLETVDYQGVAVVNYTELGVPHTRIIEHKHFEFGRQPVTWITREYPVPSGEGNEPYYPVKDTRNEQMLDKYRELAGQGEYRRCYFGGRLAEYQYYDMHQVIATALSKAGEIERDLRATSRR